MLGFLFDAIFLLAAFVTYGVSAAAALSVGAFLWGPGALRQGVVLVVAWLTFVHTFIFAVGVLKRLVQPPLEEGTCAVGPNRKYIAWGLNSVFQGLFTTAPFAPMVHLLFSSRYLYYRAMGMRVAFNSIIGTRTGIRQAELISVGPGAILGEDSFLSCHLNTDGKTHLQAAIRVGPKAVVGGRASLGPGVELGTGAVVGATSVLTLFVRVGAGAKIGPGCLVGANVSIGERARVLGGSVISKDTVIGPGEVWGGNPAVPLQARSDLNAGGGEG
jgi:acetyltransferase-like isoleucine patch superfamily enzyme